MFLAKYSSNQHIDESLWKSLTVCFYISIQFFKNDFHEAPILYGLSGTNSMKSTSVFRLKYTCLLPWEQQWFVAILKEKNKPIELHGLES